MKFHCNKLAIIGTTEYTNFDEAEQVFLTLFDPQEIDFIVSGGALGADSIGFQIAEKYEITKIAFYPNWLIYKKGAGFKRNTDIANEADFGLAFWNEISTGTLDTISKMDAQKKPIIIYNYITKTFKIKNYDKIIRK